jgi:hypothetical protein
MAIQFLFKSSFCYLFDQWTENAIFACQRFSFSDKLSSSLA